ncbi:MAG: 16S rRNA (guanine(966)-N(2))-methyltransferase RsmD [Anaeroplasmataceae bacterium]
MRINAGNYKGRKIKTTNLETTRETSDKVRQAMFNLIGQYFSGGNALDLFAGSGALGIESISRGINKCYFNDKNKQAVKVIEENINIVGCNDQSIVFNKDFEECIDFISSVKFRLVFLDPPYSMINIVNIIDIFDKNNMIDDNGIVVCETSSDTSLPEVIGSLTVLKQRKYGIKKITIYSKNML